LARGREGADSRGMEKRRPQVKEEPKKKSLTPKIVRQVEEFRSGNDKGGKMNTAQSQERQVK